MKTYTIIKYRNGKESEISGTLEELTQYFSYTLEVGHSYNPSIPKKPKTIKSLISNITKSLDIKEGSCYNRTSIRLKGETI